MYCLEGGVLKSSEKKFGHQFFYYSVTFCASLTVLKVWKIFDRYILNLKLKPLKFPTKHFQKWFFWRLKKNIFPKFRVSFVWLYFLIYYTFLRAEIRKKRPFHITHANTIYIHVLDRKSYYSTNQSKKIRIFLW